jgi:hypothetical protein
MDSQPTRTNAPEGGGEQLEMIENLCYSPAMPKGKMVGGLHVFQLPIRCEMATRIEVRCMWKLVFVPRYWPNHPYPVRAMHLLYCRTPLINLTEPQISQCQPKILYDVEPLGMKYPL